MKAIIIGAGIGGLSTAIALQRRGIDFEIYEAAPELREVGAGIWLGGNAMNVYERLGIAPQIKANSFFLDTVYIRDVKDQVLQLVDNLEIKRKYGNATHAIHRGTLQRLLAEAVDKPIQLGKRCVSVMDDGNQVRVSFEDGSTATGDLLIGADGIKSRVREQRIGTAVYRYSGQTCWRAIVHLELPKEEQVKSGEIWSRRGGVRASYSQVGPSQVYFWMTKAMASGSQFSNEEAYALIRKELSCFGQTMQKVIAHMEPEALIHTDLYDIKPLAGWYNGRVVLIGDAAHATTPNLGQGASQAIEDAYVLAASLGKTADIAAAFSGYQERRIRRAGRVVAISWMLGRITSIKSGWGSRLRNYLIGKTPNRMATRQFEFLYGVDLDK